MRLNIYYDLKFAPATFDLASYLVLCNAVRQITSFESMGVTIVADQYRKATLREQRRPESEMKFRVAHILSKLPFRIPEVDSLNITSSPLTEIKRPSFPPRYPDKPDNLTQIPYSHAYLHEFYGKEGINLRPFKASEQAKFFIDNLFGDDVITISLRTSHNKPERNSNLDEWYKVYQELKRLKFRPIVMPDFEDCMERKDYKKYDWETFEAAAFDVDLRLALQEKAINNLTINSGQSTMMVYSDSPYMMFKWESGTQITNEKSHKKNFLMDWGDNFNWATPDQHLIWEADDADIILKALNL